MKVGIVGIPGSGKSTLFNALTRGKAETGRFGAARAEMNRGRTEVPDARLEWLAEIHKPKKKTRAAVDFLDVPGIAPGSMEKGAAALLADLRTVDAIVHVVRVFEDPKVPHPEERIDPVRDATNLEMELLLADLGIVEKRLERIESDLKKGLSKAALGEEKQLLLHLKEALDEGRPIRSVNVVPADAAKIRGYAFLTQKPQIIVGNVGEKDAGREAGKEDTSTGEGVLRAHANAWGIPYLAVACQIEAEIAQMSDDDARAFLDDLGIRDPSRDRVIRTAFDVLSLISFFTFGEDECKAWTLGRGSSAVEAAGKIHSDIARGFIRAEVVSYDDFRAAGSWAGTRETGRFRLEGREYVMQDGDCVVFRFNV
jgi:GTP-binding protein YchF